MMALRKLVLNIGVRLENANNRYAILGTSEISITKPNVLYYGRQI